MAQKDENKFCSVKMFYTIVGFFISKILMSKKFTINASCTTVAVEAAAAAEGIFLRGGYLTTGKESTINS